MFTDIHSHIIPKVDDGCSNMQEALILINSSINNNVKNIILTPHFNPEKNPIKKQDFMKKIKKLNDLVKNKELEVKFYPGMEVRISPKITEFIKNKDYIVTLANKNKYMLIELPFSHEPYELSKILFEIKLMKIIPILSHPERYDYLFDKIKYLTKLHNEGLLMQVDNSSLVNSQTAPTFRRALKMLKLSIVDLIGSDCHYIKTRFSNFLPAYNKLIRIMGKEEADRIAINNPNKVLLNENIN
jgi:protein-tyrosine phosphatase